MVITFCTSICSTSPEYWMGWCIQIIRYYCDWWDLKWNNAFDFPSVHSTTVCGISGRGGGMCATECHSVWTFVTFALASSLMVNTVWVLVAVKNNAGVVWLHGLDLWLYRYWCYKPVKWMNRVRDGQKTVHNGTSHWRHATHRPFFRTAWIRRCQSLH